MKRILIYIACVFFFYSTAQAQAQILNPSSVSARGKKELIQKDRLSLSCHSKVMDRGGILFDLKLIVNETQDSQFKGFVEIKTSNDNIERSSLEDKLILLEIKFFPKFLGAQLEYLTLVENRELNVIILNNGNVSGNDDKTKTTFEAIIELDGFSKLEMDRFDNIEHGNKILVSCDINPN